MIAFLFPGQGSQRAGMIAALPDEPVVRTTLDTISDTIGQDVHDLDSADALTSTYAAQVGLFAVGVATDRLLDQAGIRADVVAGHSIGAFGAAVSSGVLTVSEGARAVAVRARRMQELHPFGYGLMAVIGLTRRSADDLVASVRAEDALFVAMENSADQIVLAGSDEALARAATRAPGFGAREARRLDVAVPSHCALMLPVAEAVAAVLETVPDRRPRTRFIAASTARVAVSGARVREDLAAGVAEMVRWRDSTDLLAELGTTLTVQLPPGHTTGALFAAAHPDIPTVSIDDSAFDDAVLRVRRFRERGPE